MVDLPERGTTVRDELARVLRQGWTSALELSSLVGITEKAVPDHLEHLRRSIDAAGGRFEIQPARCPGCAFIFRDRDRLTRPSKCPQCRAQRVQAPRFRIV
jgi:hypothetical protein